VEMKQEVFLLSWKHLWVIIVLEFVLVLLHNFFSYLLGGEEIVFFFLALVLMPIYILISVGYTLVYHISRRKTKKSISLKKRKKRR